MILIRVVFPYKAVNGSLWDFHIYIRKSCELSVLLAYSVCFKNIFHNFFPPEMKIPLSRQESGIENVKIWSRFVKLETNSVNRLYVVDVIHLLEFLPDIADMLF